MGDRMTFVSKAITLLGLAAAMVGLATTESMAQSVPAHAVRFDPVASRCWIVLEPAGTTGDHPPKLFLSSDMMETSLAFGLEGSSIVEAVLIRQGQRAPFIGREGLTLEALVADPVWSQLDVGAEGKESLYLTVRDAEGAYSSARYDDLHQSDILRLAALACGVEGLGASARTPVEYRAAEQRLDLRDKELLHIRRLLASRFGEPGTDVGEDSRFTVTDRRHIAEFNTAEGHPSGEYLWPAAVPDMLKQEAPAPISADGAGAHSDEAVLARHKDWAVLADSAAAKCRVSTVASAAEGLDPGLRLEFAIERAGKGGMMAIDLVTPNPFRADMPLAALIDGKHGFALTVEPTTKAVIPQPQADGSMTNDLTRALSHGKTIIIEGVAAASGAPSRVSFSALGFSAAFAAMSEACNRPGVMGWIK